MKAFETKKTSIFLSLVIFAIILAFVFNPETYMQSTLNGILIWGTAVLPALFPFFFLTKLLTSLNLVQQISQIFKPITTKLFNVPGVSSYVFLMSVISGYPVGVKLISELYTNGKISRAEATRMSSFCSTSGPLFILGTVGSELFLCRGAGLVMLTSHILGAFLNGLLYRKYKLKENEYAQTKIKKEEKIDNILGTTIYDSVISILIVGSYVALFFMIIDVLTNFHILSFFSDIFNRIFELFGICDDVGRGISSGIIEVTRGCVDLSTSGATIKILTILATGLISWGGLSIHFQALTFLQKSKIKVSVYFLQKFTHSIFSTILATVLSLIFL